MGMLADIDLQQLDAVERYLAKGLEAWAAKEPQNLDEWAREHFYLSGESSYVEQQWTPWPFQSPILAVMSNDDVQAIDFKKSARVGYTKMLLASVAYNAEHRRRNQCVWQPTDDDAADFVKSEIDTMLRDVKAMHAVFPTYLARHKDNTLEQKKFIGSMLRVRGGKAAKNYRRFGVDTAYLDELSGFDQDVEKEGSPDKLAAKRLEGATFPKLICGSTPKTAGFCHITRRFDAADVRFRFHIECPQCSEWHPLTFGGKELPHGFKWEKGQPDTVFHMCPHCTYPLRQPEFLRLSEQGRMLSDDRSLYLAADGRFYDAATGEKSPAPRHIGIHVWTAYSPAVSWSQLVREYIEAAHKYKEGDDTVLKTFTNTTLGEAWEGDVERTDVEELMARAEDFPLRYMPRDCLLLLCAMDTQGYGVEAGVWGIGRGGQMWTIDHKVFHGNPALQQVWDEAEQFLRTAEYPHASGRPQRIYATAIDSGGHHADAVYAWAHKLKGLRVHAIKGVSGQERSIDNGNSRVSYRWNGKIEKQGPTLWMVSTNLAKDRFQARLDVLTPGPGYVHLSKECTPEWFKQLAGEVRNLRRLKGGTESRWTATRKRIEVKDCVTYCIWLEERLDLWSPRKARFWDQLEAAVQPDDDLFSAPANPPAAQEGSDSRETSTTRPAVPVANDSRETKPKRRRGTWADGY